MSLVGLSLVGHADILWRNGWTARVTAWYSGRPPSMSRSVGRELQTEARFFVTGPLATACALSALVLTWTYAATW